MEGIYILEEEIDIQKIPSSKFNSSFAQEIYSIIYRDERCNLSQIANIWVVRLQQKRSLNSLFIFVLSQNTDWCVIIFLQTT